MSVAGCALDFDALASRDPDAAPVLECTQLADCSHLSRAECIDNACVQRPRPTAPVASTATAAGVYATSSQHRLRLSVGMPQPMGTSTSDDHRLTLGPAALGTPSAVP